MLQKKDFVVGQTVYLLVHRIFGRKVDEYIILGEVTGIGNKYLTVNDTKFNSTYQFDMKQGFMFHDPLYGVTSDVELFLTEQEILDMQQAEPLYNSIEEYFHNFTFRQSYHPRTIPPWSTGTRIDLNQLILINKLLDPESGKSLAKEILENLEGKQ